MKTSRVSATARNWYLVSIGAFLVLSWLLSSPPARAATERLDQVPEELRSWIPWVMADLGESACPQVGGAHVCQWPGLVELDLDEGGGKFRLFVELDQDGLRTIVGGAVWPQDVRVDGQPTPVLNREQVPALRLTAGRHEVTGTLNWTHIPETLEIGADTAFIDLRIQGKTATLVKREQNKIWLTGLGLQPDTDGATEHVELSVFRQIRDGVPIVIDTKIVLQVAGNPRELLMEAPWLPATIPLSISGGLAIALEPSGALRVQLVPGRHELNLIARHARPGEPLKSQARALPWPTQEVWTFRPQAELRSVELSGLSGIDPSRTDLPQDWRADGAYLAQPDSVLVLRTTRRGQEQVPTNQLHIQREFWLDETAEAFTVKDTLSGEMHQGWRLSLLSGVLGSVRVAGQTQLITRKDSVPGVEIRDATLNVQAVSRIPREARLAAVGWSEEARSLAAVLHLPPGWDVFAVQGVDESSRTWLARWDLFDVFHLLVLTFAMARLAGWLGGMSTFCALLLMRGEDGAPEYVWLPLVVLAALLGLLKSGSIRAWLGRTFYALGVLTLIILVAFSVDQVRLALYPHLRANFSDANDFSGVLSPEAVPVAPEGEPSAEMEVAEQAADAKTSAAPSYRSKRSAIGGALGRAGGSYSASLDVDSRAEQQKQLRPDAVVQTGPGIPEASGTSVKFSWSGPVARDHRMGLYLISPTLNRVLTVLRLCSVGLVLFLLWRLARSSGPTSLPRPQSPPEAQSKAVSLDSVASQSILLGLFLAFSTLFWTNPVLADQPTDERLAQLKERLTRAAPCEPDCIFVSQMQLRLDDELSATSEVHAGALGAYRLPGPANAFSRVRLRVDGRPATALRLAEDGAYYLRLPPGVHKVEMTALLKSDRVTLDVGTPPAQILVATEHWSVSGIAENGRAQSGTLTLQRDVSFTQKTAAKANEAIGQGEPTQVVVPPFFRVERSISLGVNAQVTTRLTRQSDGSTPEVFRLKLLEGERVTTRGIEVKDGYAEVAFPREELEKILTSTLTLPSEEQDFNLELRAPAASFGSETWHLECGIIYSCTTEGPPATSHIANGQASTRFDPWPDESLKIHGTQPKTADGATLTIHKATLSLTPGIRTGTGRLEVAAESSRSVIHTFNIPPRAQLESASVGGVLQAVKSEQGQVRLALPPGSIHIVLEWKEATGLSAWFSSPKVSTNAAGVNFRTVVELPSERWLLFAGGPAQGPALLFWGYLVLIVIAALLLPLLPYAPLTRSAWLLLGLGLTQVDSATAVFIVGWFYFIGSRHSWPRGGRFRTNFLQLILIGYTLAFLLALGTAVYEGLVSSPDMEVEGAGSYNGHLSWFVDRSQGQFDKVWLLSVSLWVWRGFMLLWALWLARSLLAWMRWSWEEANRGGFWVPKPPKAPATTQPPSTMPVEGPGHT